MNGNERTITGYALKFGVKSVLLMENGQTFYEILERGCITQSLLDRMDIVLTLYHDPHKVLARSNKGKGTLHYIVDSVGVKFWADMPRTQWGEEALELVKRGDLSGCSFIYSTDEDNNVKWEGGRNGTPKIRRVIKVDNVYDFTITHKPAYQETEIDVFKREIKNLNSRGLKLRGYSNCSGGLILRSSQSSITLSREAKRQELLARIQREKKAMERF